ncbi:MAG: gas vesicle protein [Solirubrobacterales bacterium]|nr:gas vesicle protein [Solirubrobacterales bacterium]
MALDPETGQLPHPRLPGRYVGDSLHPREPPASLADILERVLDKGIVIAGDIQLNLLDIELITIKIRLLIASVDRAKEMGINWWESDPTLTVEPGQENVEFRAEFEREDDGGELEARIERLERLLESGPDNGDGEAEKREAEKRATAKRSAPRPASARRATGSRGGGGQKR